MANITWSDVTAVAPELSTTPVAAQALLLLWGNKAIAADVFDGPDGDTTKLARCYLVAHAATLGNQAASAGGSGAAGPVTSESIGDLSRSFGAIGGGGGGSGGDEYQATGYGRLYWMLVRRDGASRVWLVV